MGVPDAGRPVHLAKAVDSGSPTVRPARVNDCGAKPLQHTEPRPGRIDGQEYVVQDHKHMEGLGFADGPWFLAGGLVVSVKGLGSDGIGSSDGDGNRWRQGGRVPVIRYGEEIIKVRRGYRLRIRVWRKLEEAAVRV